MKHPQLIVWLRRISYALLAVIYCLAVVLILAVSIQIGDTFACSIDKCYRRDISVGIWKYFFLIFGATLTVVMFKAQLIKPNNSRQILIGFNVVSCIVLASVFRHPSHDIWFLSTLMSFLLAANATLYLGHRFLKARSIKGWGRNLIDGIARKAN